MYQMVEHKKLLVTTRKVSTHPQHLGSSIKFCLGRMIVKKEDIPVLFLVNETSPCRENSLQSLDESIRK
jgi:hypothetical protein